MANRGTEGVDYITLGNGDEISVAKYDGIEAIDIYIDDIDITLTFQQAHWLINQLKKLMESKNE